MIEKRLEIIKENVYMRSEIAKNSRLGIDTSFREELELLKEIERLNNIINELEELLNQMLLDTKKPTILNNFEKNTIRLTIEHIQNKLKELKDSD